MLRFYRTPIPDTPSGLLAEWCYYIVLTAGLTVSEFQRLRWLLGETFDPDGLNLESFLSDCPSIIEIGPRPNFETAWSTTAVSICHACGLNKIVRLERSRRYGFTRLITAQQADEFLAAHHDRMTEMRYSVQPDSFALVKAVEPVHVIPLIEEGKDALRATNKRLGLGMDEQDIDMNYDLFMNYLKRNSTDVEPFQLGQANSEHSRHGFFNGRLVINGQPLPETLMNIVKDPWRKHPGNSIIAFCDDSSAVKGDEIQVLVPIFPGHPCRFTVENYTLHPTLTAETHNFPSGVAPYPGAATGTGGRIRDNQAVGRGGLVVTAGAAYCVDNLLIPGYDLPWEQDGWRHPANLASPIDILIQASNGASDYGNCFGEPVIYGFVRSCGIDLPDERRGWYKPIMYSVGTGLIDDRHTKKGKSAKGMLIVQIGGPAYRIGMGGGAASSMIQGDNAAELDFNAVQRGAPQMEQRMNRVVRACVEMGDDNPIITIHDLGAGGDCNALTELVEPAGAVIKLRALPVGDQTLSTLEIWGNESQERNAFLVWPEHIDMIIAICKREDVPCAIVGQVTGDGYLILHDDNDGTTPVNLPLDRILGQLPQKTFHLEPWQPKRVPLKLPEGLTVHDALDRVLRLLSVGSKRFLTTKVDRSVTGLVAQQQCVGPNQITLCDYAVEAHSYFGLTGTAKSLGEQPMIGLISPSAMSRMAVTEMILNLAGAKVSVWQDIRMSANWMLAAKEPGEGAWLYDAACALRDILLELHIAIDGGKDSLSMAAKSIGPDGCQHVIKAPGELVLAAYAFMDDITMKVTPDLKRAGHELLFIDLAKDKCRLGGSALAQVYGQVGDDCPDLEHAQMLHSAFSAIQSLVKEGMIASVHDKSDGGLITTVLEMAFAGNLGICLSIQSEHDPLSFLFNQEAGLVIACADGDAVRTILDIHHVPYEHLGWATDELGVTVHFNDDIVLDAPMVDLRAVWEETSSQIDRLQANPDCVAEEAANIRDLIEPPPYDLTFSPEPTSECVIMNAHKPKVAIIRERGSNGDREMNAAFYLAGFETFDVTMTDLLEGRATLDNFRGVAFVGGFSFADVLDAGKGWAGVICFNERLAEMFEQFRNRPDTFSLGVCNGCQLMAMLGWVPGTITDPALQPRFIRNVSGRFESRFSTVTIMSSPAIMLKGMAGSTLGIWVAHGEGRLHVPSDPYLRNLIGLIPICFTDPDGGMNERYPFNPNGSPGGVTALCSPDGRHLAMMPHPERAFLNWQWPWQPEDWKNLQASPWLRLFQNAYTWCMQNQ
ncbi:MAG: phosphoribosylformylglycinamidine synthase [Patescibacteria group bacterium]